MSQATTIDFFPCSNLQKQYFSKLSDYLNHSGFYSRVIGYKYLGFLGLLLLPFACMNINAHRRVRPVVRLSLQEKAAKYPKRSSNQVYDKVYMFLKHLESVCLYSSYCFVFKALNIQTLGIWNGLKYRQSLAVQALKSIGGRPVYFENGLIPGMTTVDARGVNYLNSMPRKAYDYVSTRNLDVHAEMRVSVSDYVFVPFQVNTDSQIVRFSPFIKQMDDLYELLKLNTKHLPVGVKFLIKLHPASNVDYSALIEMSKEDDRIDFTSQPTEELIENALAILTINSTVGIEALLKGKPVITIGKAFYNIDGLVIHCKTPDELSDALELLPSWEANRCLQEKFIERLKAYQVDGRWQDASPHHLNAMKERLVHIINNEAPDVF